MLKTNNEIVRRTRKEMGLSQRELAEQLFMDQKALSRIESGKKNLNVWEYLSIMQMVGRPEENFYRLMLESKEFEDYCTYKELRRLIRDGKHSEAKDILADFEKNLTATQSFLHQYVAFAKVYLDSEMPHEEAVERLYEVLRMSIRDFDKSKMAKYRYDYNEVHILSAIAIKLDKMGETEQAIDIYKALIESRNNILGTDEDKAALLPALLYSLSSLLGKTGDYIGALKYCEEAYEISKKYYNLRLIPYILYNIASCSHKLNKGEEICKPYLVRAYHSAYAIGYTEVAAEIKKDAKESFGIVDL